MTSYPDPPLGGGRYHRPGGRPAWYASNQEQAAWAELFRHLLDGGVSPFEVLRRVGAVDVAELNVLDLCERGVRAQLGLSEEDLTADDYSLCQAVAEEAAHHFDGILAPSAALDGRRTLVVFPAGMAELTVVSSRVRQPPPRLADLLHDIRLHRDVPSAVRSYLRSLAAAGADAIRRQRRQG
ncbi:MAG: RES family NAD+ phosphorylase [Acidimicrobiia bacterium]